MSSLAERIARMLPADREAAIRSLGPEKAAALMHQWRGFWARADQVAPNGGWLVWMILAGRGYGKTRTGAEWVREEVDAGRATRIALIGETHKDLEEVMVYGDSGLANIWPAHQRPTITKKPIKITFHNGAQAFGYNATEPEQMRGPQFDLAWCDELAKWRHAQDAWDQLQFALRLGTRPRVVVTTTPRPTPLVRALVKRADAGDGVVITRGRTFDNRANLATTFLREVEAKYGGTRLGRQELEAEVLDDAPGALWTRAMIDARRVREAPTMKRIVIAVDPAVSSEETSDDPGEHGISVAGIGEDGRGYVLDDASIQGTPETWARRVVSLYDLHEADAVVVETNQGGEMVASTLRAVRPGLKIVEVRASRGKHVRAEPISALYEQGRVSHVGSFAELEDQLCNMTQHGYLGARSPDRLDALVWAMTDLFERMIRVPRGDKRPPRPAVEPGRDTRARWMAR